MTDELVHFVTHALEALADPVQAAPMAAYMKTVPEAFYGVPKPARQPLLRESRRRFVPADAAQWRAATRALWDVKKREARYLAIDWAASPPFAKRWLDADAVPLLETMIRDGAWWDTVDAVVGQLLSPLVLRERDALRPVLERWIDDPSSMWLRRAAILAQLKHKAHTDAAMLFDFCRRRAGEREFFVRKAIGWALREYSYTAPEQVREFLAAERERLSGLSFREGARALRRMGLEP